MATIAAAVLVACASTPLAPRVAPADLGAVPLACTEGLAAIASPRPLPLALDLEALALDCREPRSSRWSLRSDGLWLNVALKDAPPPSALRVVPGRGGGRALEVDLPPSAPRPRVMQKVMIEVYGRLGAGPAEMIAFDEPRVFAFELRLADDFEAPADDQTRLIVFQLWQGAPYGPPLRMEIDSERRAVFYRLDDRTGSHPCAASPGCSELARDLEGVAMIARSAPLARGSWHEVVIAVTPSHREAGELRVWLDDAARRAPLFAGRTRVGFDPRGYARYPDAESRGLAHPNEVLDASFGIYRTPQRARQAIAFDHVRVGRTLAEVDAAL